ncbi:uncharacterized protein [Haliotis cracherodii]|uniref:uncharacterized protein n=1 Tax=Haliotis cracherodii TaxID=6455 RepID=UPI0039E7FDDF
MAIFHIKYPKRRGFLKWDELGCLARTLGFQVDLFRSNVTDEITVEKDGILIKEVLQMLEYKLLYKSLHQTVNMHSAEWNMAAMRKVMLLLDHKALSFEELDNVRVAYQLYEAGDMKGMLLDKHTLLRCLKMCGRMIAPLKLMHRIKHMKEHFEEAGRIQLAEFFDLILWCDIHSSFRHADMEYTEGKENQLFKLVDFEKLLCHHDDRIAWVLNKKYLKDEWDFGHETLSSNRMFKEPPITNEARIQQTKFHKRSYCHLKNEVGHSQKRVYRAHAGYIRGRPITAPNLSMYRPKEEEQKAVETTAKEAYQTVRQRLRSAPSTARSTSLFADRPTTREYQRLTTPQVVTRGDLSEVETKLNGLKFDMITMDSKYDIDKEEKMDHYLPGYRDKLAQRPPPVPPPEPKPEPPKSTHWTEEVIEELVHPKQRLPPSHARKCDARFRGWHQVRTRRGSHFVLVSRCYDSSPKGNLFTKLRERTFTPVQHIHKDHLYRHTTINQVQRGKGRLGEERPVTAPAFMQRTRVRREKEVLSESMEGEIVHPQAPTPRDVDKDVPLAFGEDARHEEGMVGRKNDKEPSPRGADFGYESFEEELQSNEPLVKKVLGGQMKGTVVCDEGVGNMEPDSGRCEDVEIPVPHMEHSKPKIVEVGQIGTIALLEKIAESQDLEDIFSQSSPTRQDDNHESDGRKSEETKINLVMSSPAKFNQVTEVPCTSSPDPELDVPDSAMDRHTYLKELNNDRSECTSMENQSEIMRSRTKNDQNEPTPKSKASNLRTKSSKSEHPESTNQVLVMKHLKPRSASSVRSSNHSVSSSLKRCYSAGNQRRNSSLSNNSKHFRLVHRVSDSISKDLRKRLLTAGHC